MSDLENASRSAIEAHQLACLEQGLSRILPLNRFYRNRLGDVPPPLKAIEDLNRLPFTIKRDLLEDQTDHPPYGWNLTYPLGDYIRFHQTSGTTGVPLRVLDTRESWDWWAECWGTVLQAAGVTREDIVFLAFGFGPFIGSWTAYEGSKRVGALTIPGGGMDSLQRLRAIMDIEATVLICTPSYGLRLAELAREVDLTHCLESIRVTIHVGEPGASIPATRKLIEKGWGAKAYDQAGMTEMGAYGFSCQEQNGLHVNESEFIAEILDPYTWAPVEEGQTGELILTNLGRWGNPAIRYRTGDLVRNGGYSCPCGRSLLHLPGGIVGRVDDMLIVRGVNIYPSAIEAIVRRFPEVSEYKVIVMGAGSMDEIELIVECPAEIALQIASELHSAFNLRIPVQIARPGSLPRFELKARRIEDHRRKN